ncbi:MAG: hypothetical protein NTW19_14030 [Planctomycetota bacterium]|nr:hypothetical protein [Planctomycetota bacterium]
MDILDYGSSFLSGNWPLNRVRCWIESRTRIVDERSGHTEDYFQCGSCKAAAVFGEGDLMYPDNYDFLPIFGPEFGIIFRRKASADPGYRSIQPVGKMWGGPTYKLKPAKAARLLGTNAEIRQATHDGVPLVARTRIADAATGLHAILEYPVKVMNIQDDRDLYQVEAGPLALPDLSSRPARLVDSLSLAFVTFNRPDRVEFLIEDETPILRGGEEVGRVHHFSRPLRVPAENRVYALEA